MSVADRSWAARMFVRASGWAEREGGARRRVRCCCCCVDVEEGISKSEVVSIVNEGAMVAVTGRLAERVVVWSIDLRVLFCEKVGSEVEKEKEKGYE